MLIDAPAGIGCPVIAAMRGCDIAILISEPTPSGFSDLKRIAKIAEQFRIPFKLVINKWDINPRTSNKMEKWAGENFLGKISYDKKVIESIVKLQPVLFSDSKVVNEIRKIFNKINAEI